MTYFMKVGIAFDQFLHSLLLGGDPDLTFSARCYRWHMKGKRSWPMHLVNLLFFWQIQHCHTAYESEMDRLHLPSDMRLKRLDEE